MARVVAMILIESCLDSSTVKEIELDQDLGEELMRRMATEARLQYYPHFPRPYFRIERERCYVIQGVLGNRSFRVTFSPAADEAVEQGLKELIES
jgi:hypothetical protein